MPNAKYSYVMAAKNAWFAVIVGLLTLTSVSRHRTATALAPSDAVQPRHRRDVASVRRLPASIYYPDGDDEGGHYEEYSSPTSTATSSSAYDAPYGMSLFGQLAARLSSDPRLTSTLAKLASAFSPPGFTFDLANVNDVRCSSLDGRHIEIEAVVCDDRECSSLLVPVEFPEECTPDDGLAACVLRNVGELDAAGERVLREREGAFAREGEARSAWEALRSPGSEHARPSSSGPFPEWWVPPGTSEDASECLLLEDLLNGDDMQDATRGLATHVLRRMGRLGEGGWVRAVRVLAVGPTGMVLRVQYSIGGKTWEDDGGANNEAAVDFPVKYDQVTYGRRSIRDNVLAVISTVNAAH